MESEPTIRDFIVLHRSAIIWIVSIALGALAYWLTTREFGNWLAAHRVGGYGLYELDVDADEHVLNPERLVSPAVRWGYTAAIGLSVAALAVIITNYVLDRGTKELIEAGMDIPVPLCKRSPRDSVLVFIHGWHGDTQKTWEQFPKLACDDARFARTEIVSLGYPTYMKQSGYTVVETAMWIHKSLADRMALQAEEKLAVVAHSMGGLIAREIALVHPISSVGGRIVGITTIASPHNGALVGAIATALNVSPKLTSDMKHGSSMLAALHARWNGFDRKLRPPLVCFGSLDDKVVTTDSAFFQCDEHYKFQQWGHSEMVKPKSRDDARYRLPMQHVAKALGR